MFPFFLILRSSNQTLNWKTLVWSWTTESKFCPSDRYQSSIYTVCYDAAHNFSNPSLTPKPQTKSNLLLLLHGVPLWWVLDELSFSSDPMSDGSNRGNPRCDPHESFTAKPGFRGSLYVCVSLCVAQVSGLWLLGFWLESWRSVRGQKEERSAARMRALFYMQNGLTLRGE